MFKQGIQEHESTDSQATWDENRKRRGALIATDLSPTTPNSTIMAYFVKNHDMPRKFDVEKAEALGIPRGKLWGRLKMGEDIELPVRGKDGKTTARVFKSEEVLQPTVPGKTVLVLDVPNVEYVDKVLASDGLNAEAVKKTDVVVHMLANEVADDRRYIEWIDTFSEATKVRIFYSVSNVAFGHGTEIGSRQSCHSGNVYIASRSQCIRQFDIPSF